MEREGEANNLGRSENLRTQHHVDDPFNCNEPIVGPIGHIESIRRLLMETLVGPRSLRDETRREKTNAVFGTCSHHEPYSIDYILCLVRTFAPQATTTTITTTTTTSTRSAFEYLDAQN
jgi:hypothetical protein